MIYFKYTQFQVNKEDVYEDVSEAVSDMEYHFYQGLSCAQVVIDEDNKIIYNISGTFEDFVLERDLDIKDFKDFEIKEV